MTDATQTPVAQAYREWRDFSAWLNGPATSGMSPDALAQQTDVLDQHVARVVAAPSQSPLDTIIKLHVAVTDYRLFDGIEALEPLTNEARALVDAPETPIMQLFRQHRATSDDATADRIEAEMMALPCTCAADFAAKVIVTTARGEVFTDWESGPLWAEARALTGWDHIGAALPTGGAA